MIISYCDSKDHKYLSDIITALIYYNIWPQRCNFPQKLSLIMLNCTWFQKAPLRYVQIIV